MKNVFIGGPIRSGKSTLAQMLYHQLNYSVLELDTIVHSFTVVFPELGINEKYPKDMDARFGPFAYEVLNCCDMDRKYGGIRVCINGFQLKPETISKFRKVDNMIVVYLGMSDVTPEQLFDNIKRMQKKGDWTMDKNDTSLLEICKQIVNTSKEIKQECEKYNYLYFDTSVNREQVLQSIVDYLRENN